MGRARERLCDAAAVVVSRPAGGAATSRRRPLALLAGLGVLAGVASPAAAHVDVLPVRVEQNRAQELTIRVPTERGIPTTAVTVAFPPQVSVFAFEPVPGWTRTVVRAGDGTVTGVRYTGGRIAAGEYQDFTVLATPFGAPGRTVWRVRQTYADGAVKPWTGPPEEPGAESEESGPTEPGPAAAVEIVAAGAAGPAAAVTTGEDDGSSAGIWLGVIAIAIAAGAALAVGFLWSTRPMSLPEDPPAGGSPPDRPRDVR
ncbi:MAG: DUF1775 domain-containing protein [Actinomycetota bacterium]